MMLALVLAIDDASLSRRKSGGGGGELEAVPTVSVLREKRGRGLCLSKRIVMG